MRYIFIIVALFISMGAHAQGIWQPDPSNKKMRSSASDSVLILPRDTVYGNGMLFNGITLGNYGRIAVKGGKIFYHDSTKFTQIATGSADLSNYYTKTELQTSGQSNVHFGNLTNKPTTLSGYGITDAVPSTRTITLTAGSGISITGGAQNLSANRTWTITNTGAPASGSTFYINNQELTVQPANFLIGGKGRAERGVWGHNWAIASSGVSGIAAFSQNILIDPTKLGDPMVAGDTATFGARGIVFRPDDSITRLQPYYTNIDIPVLAGDVLTPTYFKMFHEGNDGAGSGLDADRLDGMSSENFVHNQTAVDQVAGLRVSGQGRFGTSVGIGNNTTNPVSPLDVRGADGALARFQSNSAGTQRALIISVNNSTADVGLAASGAGSGNMVFLTGTAERGRISMSTGFWNFGATGTTATATVHAQGSFATAITTITATTTLDATHHTINVNNSGNITVNLPAAASASGRIYVIKKISNNAFTISVDPSGSENIEGASTAYSITTYLQSITIQSDGTAWWIY